jgi:hypothetical protein
MKPDKGALGIGIKVIPPQEDEPLPQQPCIVQEYIQSYLYRGFKFDFRIYCLVIWETGPLIYVYRDGVARVCSAPSTEHSIFSQLTNTAVNRANPGTTLESITRSVPEVLADLGQSPEVIEGIWNQIDDAVVFSVLSGLTRIQAGMRSCPRLKFDLYPRCFHLLGFDVLLDVNLKPWVLEVNYRPSLDWGTAQEHDMKVALIEDVARLVLPSPEFDAVIDHRNDHAAMQGGVQQELYTDKGLEKQLRAARIQAERTITKFKKVYPLPEPSVKWTGVLEAANRLAFTRTYRG